MEPRVSRSSLRSAAPTFGSSDPAPPAALWASIRAGTTAIRNRSNRSSTITTAKPSTQRRSTTDPTSPFFTVLSFGGGKTDLTHFVRPVHINVHHFRLHFPTV